MSPGGRPLACGQHVCCAAVHCKRPGIPGSWLEPLRTIESALPLPHSCRRGFTTVRDAGGADWGLAQAVEEGTILGPRLLFSGHALSQTGGHGDMRGRRAGHERRKVAAGLLQPAGFSWQRPAELQA